MTIDKALCRKVLENACGLSVVPGRSTSEVIDTLAENLVAAHKARQAYEAWLKAEGELVLRHAEERLVHDRAAEKMRRDCKHQLTTYHSDTNDSSDSYYTCDLCGQEAKKF